MDNQFKIRLASASVGDDIQQRRNATVTFDVTPELVENRNINYKSYDPVHAPGQIYVYQNTQARTFQLSNIRFVSRTSKEASVNLAKLWILRSWTMPNFGSNDFSTTRDTRNVELEKGTQGVVDVRELIRNMSGTDAASPSFLGAPPQVLFLSAFSRFGATGEGGAGSVGHLRNIPVVITQFSIPYPTDVDYIPTADSSPTPMPTILTVDIQLVETHSPNEYEQFSLEQFRTADLTGF